MKQKKRYWRLAGLFLILALLGGGILFLSSLQKPEIAIEGVGASITFHGVDIDISLALHNPNLIPLTIKDFHAIASANDVFLAETVVPQIYLPAGEIVRQKITVTLSYVDLGVALVSAIRERSVTWRTSGAYSVEFPLGFEKKYTFSIVR